MSDLATTASDVVEHFAVTDEAVSALRRWSRERPEVAEFVMNHITRVPYKIDRRDVERVVRGTEHALGEIRKSDVDGVHEVKNWNPRFALAHVFHYALESIGDAFTYQEFRDFCYSDTRAHEMCWVPAEQFIQRVAVESRHSERTVRDAMHWRVGNAYYSFLRELYCLTWLRSHCEGIRVHPLADALFRVDAWVNNKVLVLYIGNKNYRDGVRGRKVRTEDLLGPTFCSVPLRMKTQRRFGRVHLPSDAELYTAARLISEE